jgi:hypothetical protein
MKSKLIILALALPLLSACSGQVQVSAPATTSPIVTSTDPLAQLKAFTLSDLTAATADAHATGDQTAYQCYDYLITWLPTLPSFTPATNVGAVLAFQKLRDLNASANNVQNSLKPLNLACAPLVIDTQTTINKLISIAGGAAATGGITGILPVLPLP